MCSECVAQTLGPLLWKQERQGGRIRRCRECGATWEAFPGDPCPWCARRAELAREREREAVLRPGTDRITWGEDLLMAVDAGLITRQEARQAIMREGER